MWRTTGTLALILVLAVGTADAQVVLLPTHYDLDFEPDYADEVLRATARIVVENPATEPVREVSLLLYRLLRVHGVSDDQGASLPFTQTVVAFEDAAKLQVNQVLVTLPQPLAPGAQTAIRMRYDGPVVGYAETGMRYIQDRIDPEFTILRDDTWAYPQPGYPSRAINRSAPPGEFSYAARVTVPKGLVVANAGRLEGMETVGDRVTFRFTSVTPSWRMDFAIAQYGERSVGPIRVYYLPGDSAGAAGVVHAAEQALDLFSRWFGPRRGAGTFTFIEVPDGFGSQADVAAVIQSAAAFRDPSRHREVYHELSHLWNVPPTDRPAPRWDEGLASFLEYLVHQQLTGEAIVDEWATGVLDWLRSSLPAHPDWSRVPLTDYGRANLTDLSYSVGALFFDLLYRIGGQDAFNRAIRTWVAEFGASGGSTKDLGDTIVRVLGPDYAGLVDDWLYTTGWTAHVERSTGIEDLATQYRAGARGQPR